MVDGALGVLGRAAGPKYLYSGIRTSKVQATPSSWTSSVPETRDGQGVVWARACRASQGTIGRRQVEEEASKPNVRSSVPMCVRRGTETAKKEDVREKGAGPRVGVREQSLMGAGSC